MGLNNLIGSSSVRRHSWFIILVLFIFMLLGCGESEEATKEEPKAQGVKPTAEQQKPKEENQSDQALTSFIGADTEPAEAPPPAPAVSPTQLAQYEKQIEGLRTENTSLKQNIVKLEQENRSTNARMTEVDAKYAAEKHYADSLEMLNKTSDIASKGVETPQKLALNEERTLPVSQSTYDNAMKAFRARKYDSAAKGFEAIGRGTNDDLAKRATYWLGETYFAQKKYKEALPLFQEALKFKNSEKKADAQFMIARTYENLGSKAKAKAEYEKVVKNYPMSKNVKAAKARWAKL
jgi:TolA-binding protein